MKVKYYCPDHGETEDSAIELDVQCSHAGWAAEDCAEYEHNNRDGWEAKWPMKICVWWNDEWHTFNVYRESHPVFSAFEV